MKQKKGKDRVELKVKGITRKKKAKDDNNEIIRKMTADYNKSSYIIIT